MLTDVALQLAEGERILMRSHKAISADKLLEIALRSATVKKDKATLDRLVKVIAKHGDEKLKTQLATANKLAGASRGSDPMAMVSVVETTPEQFAIYQNIIKQLQAAQIAGNRDALKDIEDALNGTNELSDKQREYLLKITSNARAEIPEGAHIEVLDKLASAARGPFGTHGHTTINVDEQQLAREQAERERQRQLEIQEAQRRAAELVRRQRLEEMRRRLLQGSRSDDGSLEEEDGTFPVDEDVEPFLRSDSNVDNMMDNGIESSTDETSRLEGESRGWGLEDLDPFNKNSGVRQMGRDFDRERLKMMSNSPRPGRDYTKVYARNGTRETIWVAVRYEPYEWSSGESKLAEYAPDKDGPFDTHAWFKLAPGQRAHLANTANIHFYIYAESQGRSRMWSGSHRRPVGNRTIGFAEKLIVAPQYEEYTINIK